MALPSNLRESTQTHLEELVVDQTQEGQHLDFKRDVPTAWDNAAKAEFLADVSAFANASGGDVVYGVEEDGEAKASAIVPQAFNPDQEVRRLQDFLVHQVEPRMVGVQVQAIAVSVGGAVGHALVIRVPQSWVGPHRVRINQHFYLREGARKRQLDVPEIRGLFLRSESQGQRVRDFRAERISRILTGETPHALNPGAVLVVHLIPSEAALGLVQIDPLDYAPSLRAGASQVPLLARLPAGSSGINLDGALSARYAIGPTSPGYSLLFRNGFLEATCVYDSPNSHDPEHLNLPGMAYEQDCIRLVDNFRAELARLGLSSEMTAMLTLLQAHRLRLSLPPMHYSQSGQEGLFDRQHIILPDVQLSADVPTGQALKPVFDLVGQACGISGSPNYDANGQRKTSP